MRHVAKNIKIVHSLVIDLVEVVYFSVVALHGLLSIGEQLQGIIIRCLQIRPKL
jgi:hypothetical protein